MYNDQSWRKRGSLKKTKGRREKKKKEYIWTQTEPEDRRGGLIIKQKQKKQKEKKELTLDCWNHAETLKTESEN